MKIKIMVGRFYISVVSRTIGNASGILVLLISLLTLLSCAGGRNGMQKAVAVHRMWWFDPQRRTIERDSLSGDVTMLYKDSFVLVMTPTTQIVEVDGISTTTYPLESFTLIDLRKRTFYHYRSFSDTARLLSVNVADANGRVEGGWSTFRTDTFMYSGSREYLADTVMDGVTYKRIKGYRTQIYQPGDTGIASIVAYYSCEKKKLPLHIDYLLSKQLGCPVMRKDFLWHGTFRYSELKYADDKFTLEQERVMDAWIRNSRNKQRS